MSLFSCSFARIDIVGAVKCKLVPINFIQNIIKLCMLTVKKQL